MRICLCSTQVPFSYGGAEMLVESLRDELKRRGFAVEVVTLPFAWSSRLQLLKSAMAWRLVDLTEAGGKRIDRVIATRFPSYLIKHPYKVVWLVHQMRQVYDLLGTPYSDFAREGRDQKVIDMVRAMDRRTLGEARAVYTISQNTADRLKRWNGLTGTALHPPPRLVRDYREGEFGDYVFAVGRLDVLKRFDLLIRGIAESSTAVRCKIAGTGPEEGALRALAEKLGVAERVELLGWVDDRDLIPLYAGSLAVFYAPYDEDYGYVTVEAMKSGKPVLTATDSGGVLEFVVDGENGFVCPPGGARELGARIDLLYRDREKARSLGAAGLRRVRTVDW
ncbi:MAG TPA: glycosyltransferase family 4 protein, partial [Thermoanaerobaculia bacterium]|nr:glycosyltransferase family 4 protein [Thermoanaerobaculia bacterium]